MQSKKCTWQCFFADSLPITHHQDAGLLFVKIAQRKRESGPIRQLLSYHRGQIISKKVRPRWQKNETDLGELEALTAVKICILSLHP